MSQEVELSVELVLHGLDPVHRAHQAAVDDFVQFANETPGVRLTDGGVEGPGGTKGGWEPLVLSVASPTAIVALFRLWLHRDRRRSVRVKIASQDKPPVEVEASGENVSLEALKASVEAALKASGNQRR